MLKILCVFCFNLQMHNNESNPLVILTFVSIFFILYACHLSLGRKVRVQVKFELFFFSPHSIWHPNSHHLISFFFHFNKSFTILGLLVLLHPNITFSFHSTPFQLSCTFNLPNPKVDLNFAWLNELSQLEINLITPPNPLFKKKTMIRITCFNKLGLLSYHGLNWLLAHC